MLSITMVMFEMDVGTMQCGSAASTTAQWYGLMPKSNPEFQLMSSQVLVIMCVLSITFFLSVSDRVS
jgi:hypothetical protein